MTNGSRVGWHVWKNQYQRHKLRDSLMANRSHRLLSSLLREWHWACYTDFDACDALNFLTPVDRHLVPRDYSGLPETWRCQTLSQGPLLTSTVWQLRLLQEHRNHPVLHSEEGCRGNSQWTFKKSVVTAHDSSSKLSPTVKSSTKGCS